MAIRLPDQSNGGKVSTATVGTLDLYRTLVDYCKLEGPEHTLDGQSLRPLLEDPQAEWDRPVITSYGPGYFSIRDSQYRYIQYPDGTEELYDHKNDPKEFDNRADDRAYAEIKKRLKKQLPEKSAKSLGGRLG